MIRKILQKIKSGTCETIDWLCIVSLVIMLIVTMIIVIGRYFFNKSPSWGEEITLFFMTWVGLFSAAISEADKEHVRISFLDNLYPPFLLRICNIIRYYLKLFFFYLLIKYGLVLFSTTSQRFAAFSLSFKWQYLPGILLGVCCAVFSVIRFKDEMTDRYERPTGDIIPKIDPEVDRH